MTKKEVNSRLRRTKIKGKDYVEVSQRLQGFWELYPNGRIETQMVSDDGDRCCFKCYVFRDGEDRPCATGHAFETKESSAVNRTSYIENCETSAVGRALGMLGIGSTESIASAEEVSNAIAAQDLKAAQSELIEAEIKYCELNGIADFKAFHKNEIMTRADYANEAETIRRIAQELKEA